jgi:hypothetical protein
MIKNRLPKLLIDGRNDEGGRMNDEVEAAVPI